MASEKVGAKGDERACCAYESLKCKGCCTGGDGSKIKPQKHVRFSEDVKRNDGDGPRVSLYPKGVCACCKEGCCPSSGLDVGRPVLVYEIPEPKFDNVTTHKRDFGVKPLPPRQMPLWHPILKDRWRYLDVPSIDKSIYQCDFTPPVNCTDTQRREPVYLAPKKEKRDPCRELSKDFKVWRKTSKGQCEVINVCDRKIVAKDELLEISCSPVSKGGPVEFTSGVAQDSKCGKDSSCSYLHGPDCEKHCFSTPLMCHDKSPDSATHQQNDMNFHGNQPSSPMHNKVSSNGLGLKKDYLYHPEKSTMKFSETLKLEPASCPRKCQFTLCESGMASNLKDCWKTTSCEPQMPNSSDQHVALGPYCPSYLTMHQRDFKRPPMVKKEISMPDECGCTGKKEEVKLYPTFERGGLI